MDLATVLASIKQMPQRQDSLEKQLQSMHVIANKFGLYDAADFVNRILTQNRELLRKD